MRTLNGFGRDRWPPVSQPGKASAFFRAHRTHPDETSDRRCRRPRLCRPAARGRIRTRRLLRDRIRRGHVQGQPDQRRPQLHSRRGRDGSRRGRPLRAFSRHHGHDAAGEDGRRPMCACRRRFAKRKIRTSHTSSSALEAVAASLRSGQLVILESTTYPGRPRRSRCLSSRREDSGRG